MAVRESEAQILERLVAALDHVEKKAGLEDEDVAELRALVEKIARQPAVFMPARSAPVAKSAQASAHAPNIVETLLKWIPGASPETKAYLERCAQLEAQR
jgi:hypothetical protein